MPKQKSRSFLPLIGLLQILIAAEPIVAAAQSAMAVQQVPSQNAAPPIATAIPVLVSCTDPIEAQSGTDPPAPITAGSCSTNQDESSPDPTTAYPNCKNDPETGETLGPANCSPVYNPQDCGPGKPGAPPNANCFPTPPSSPPSPGGNNGNSDSPGTPGGPLTIDTTCTLAYDLEVRACPPPGAKTNAVRATCLANAAKAAKACNSANSPTSTTTSDTDLAAHVMLPGGAAPQAAAVVPAATTGTSIPEAICIAALRRNTAYCNVSVKDPATKTACTNLITNAYLQCVRPLYPPAVTP
jgi:hypothetical protein